MTTFPKDKLPTIATDPTWTSGPDTGQPTRVAVPVGEQTQGMIGGARYPASKFNYLLGVTSDYVRNVAESPLRTWDRIEGWQSTQVVPGLPFVDNDKWFGMFAYARGAENSGHTHIFGTDVASTTLRDLWTYHGNIYQGPTFTGGGQILEMAASPSGNVIAVGPGMSNKVEASSDDVSFTAVNTHGAFNYATCCYAGSKFFAMTAGSPYQVGVSTTGVTWTVTAANPALTWAAPICRAGVVGGLAAVLISDGVSTMVSTNDGASWSAAGTIPVGAVDIQYSAGAGLWMAVSRYGATSISADGINWTARQPVLITAGGGFTGVQHLATDGGGAWVIAGNIDSGNAPGPFIAYSVDAGASWNAVRLDEGSSRVGVCWNPVEQRFYAFCHVLAGTRHTLIFRTPSYGTGGGMIFV